MVTLLINHNATKKNANQNLRYVASIYFDEFLFKTFPDQFKDLQTLSHIVESFLLENFIEPGNVITIIERYHYISTTDFKTVKINGLPYGTHYKTNGKYTGEY
jgi:hypothetical protein